MSANPVSIKLIELPIQTRHFPLFFAIILVIVFSVVFISLLLHINNLYTDQHNLELNAKALMSDEYMSSRVLLAQLAAEENKIHLNRVMPILILSVIGSGVIISILICHIKP